MERNRALVMRTGGGAGPEGAEGVVLFLHGGRSDGLGRPRRWNLPALRMLPFARAVRAAAGGRGVVTGVVRYRHRGWNGGRADALRDAEDALTEVARRFGPVPVVLVGHSMGGRAALRAAGRTGVRGVVALAPWCPPDEPVDQLTGTRTVLLHGDADRITDPHGSLAFAARARAAGAAVCRLVVNSGDHAMLRRAPDWHRTTATLATGLLGLTSLPADVTSALHNGPATTRLTGLALPLPRGGLAPGE
ncbi:alpha/beta hydrolase [Streptomyces sp. MS19]|uniref:alpha/beta hydrolase n=1 Tax=Streptomyces sp. MS19 TaxID=3385972 RepID=UPI0039A1BFBB